MGRAGEEGGREGGRESFGWIFGKLGGMSGRILGGGGFKAGCPVVDRLDAWRDSLSTQYRIISLELSMLGLAKGFGSLMGEVDCSCIL